MERWKGKVALVTGASAGIGAGICRELVKHGMIVVGCARRIDKIKAITEEDNVKKSPGKLVPMQCDLTKESEILDVFNNIRTQFSRLDVCISNGGLSHVSPLLTGTTSDWKNMLDVNVLALCICNREAVKLMRETKIEEGQIINISSTGGHRVPTPCPPGIHFYCGTKFMVRTLTEGLRRELKTQAKHIRIGSISPGVVETEFFDNLFKNDPNRKGSDFYGDMRCLQSKDIADAAIYILGSPPHVEVHDIIVRPSDQTT